MAETHFEPVGRLRVQVSPAHKFGTDAFLLADFAAPRRRDTVCDLGTGCGIVALCWYRREETAPARVDCVDIQPAAIGQLTATLEENAGVLAGRIVPHLADLKALALPAGGYDLVTCNPPYKGAGAGILSETDSDRLARHETACTIADIAAAAARLLKYGGRLCVCQRPERLADVMEALRRAGIEPKRLRFVHQRPDRAPWLFLLEGRRGGKPFLSVEAPLIVEGADGCIMFQIESNNSWYYEISDTGGQYYLYLGGANEPFGDWCKPLQPGESYTSVPVALCTAGNAESAIREMTKYRRRIAGRCAADEGLPVIFNEYMHLSWDSPSEENTRRCALAAAEAGAEYYVIDCGWHDEVPGSEVYPYVGVWKESKARFPSGLRKTTDYIRSLGMKPGLWIEPEVVGYKCGEMLAYYGEDCFFRRHGKKVCVQGRYFLDFRAEKVRAYLTETVRRMVEEYGAEYIKTDYNQDAGVGTERDAASFGEGLELCAKAYLGWVDEMRARFPQVLFETCASGGLRMDHETLQHFSIVSTSDQTDYKKYPYIAGNILSAALPEQAAVWSYPVGSDTAPNGVFAPTRAWVEENITEEQVVMNMVNALLGRMHLASRIGLLSAEKFALVQEGVAYYKTLSKAKKEALPVFPLGFTSFGEKQVAAGFEAQGKVYLAVWNLGGGNTLRLPLRAPVTEVRVAYPQAGPVRVRTAGTALEVAFTKPFQACFLEAEQKKK